MFSAPFYKLQMRRLLKLSITQNSIMNNWPSPSHPRCPGTAPTLYVNNSSLLTGLYLADLPISPVSRVSKPRRNTGSSRSSGRARHWIGDLDPGFGRNVGHIVFLDDLSPPSPLEFGLVSTLIYLWFEPGSLAEPHGFGCHVQPFMWGLELSN